MGPGLAPQVCLRGSRDFYALEKEMAIHSSVLAWRIPGTGEPGGLPSMGSHRVGHDWSDLAAEALLSLGASLGGGAPEHAVLRNGPYRTRAQEAGPRCAYVGAQWLFLYNR